MPLVSNEAFIHEKTLQGLSFKDVTVSVLRPNGKIKKSITHDLLITHFGLSGPAALRASFEVINELEKNETVDVLIDFVPKLTKQTLLDSKDNFISLIKENEIPERLIKYIEK